MGLITIKTFDNSVNAHLLRLKLEREGVNCFIFDENMVSLIPLYNITVGGIKIKINEADFDKAKEIIEEFNSSKLTNENEEIIRCPKCQSENLYNGFKSMKGIKGVISAIVSFLLMVYPIYYKYVYKCKSCGNEFKY